MKKFIFGFVGIFSFACGVPDDRKCDPGTAATCDGTTLTTCVAADNGDSFIVTQTCGDGTTCDATAGACVGAITSFCGDGTQDGGEDCDNGAANGTPGNTCNADCTTARCGDGITGNSTGEECDDGNNVDTDACKNNCKLGGGQPPRCGDGNVDAGEQCDNGLNLNNAACNADCTTPRCGDGITGNSTGEECDDANNTNTDACSNACKINIAPGCGNGVVDAGEQCDTALAAPCDVNCTTPTCGNGIVSAGEECDDANNINTDACLSTCKLASCGDGAVQSGADQCDEGPNNGSATCDVDCTLNVCGDGIFNDNTEQCEDGNNANGDGCDAACQFEGAITGAICGNNIVEGAEQCDDNNTANGDGCEGDCTFACGAELNPVKAAFDASDGHCYASFSQTTTWFSAESSCEAKGGYLAVPDSIPENDLILTTRPNNSEMWIGLNDNNPESNNNPFLFKEVTGDFISFNFFTVNQPSGAAGENCVHYNFGGSTWNDFPCNDAGNIPHFVCEIEPVTCGDGVAQLSLGEECDDGNAINGDACNNDCTQPRCGDGIEQSGEVCFAPNSNTFAGNGVFSITSADFNEDGILDVITANFNDNNYTFLRGNPDGTLVAPTVVGVTGGGLNPTRGAAADLNGDGHQDYIGAAFGPSGSMSILFGNGDGTFQPQVNLGGLAFPISFDLADLDNDGDLDLIVGNAQNGNPNVSLFTNNGGAFSAPTNINAGTNAIRSVRVRDFNGDGKLDIAAAGADTNQTLNILTGDGAGNFTLSSSSVVNSGGEAIPGDFNNDGRQDMVVGQNDNTIKIFINNGDAAPSFSATTINLIDATNDVNVGDFNEDGNLDIAANVFVFNVKSAMAIILGNGNGTFQAPRFIPAGNTPIATVVEPRDYNRDGHLDIATRGGVNGELITILWGYGNGAFTENRALSTGTTDLAIIVKAGDLNNDGILDLVSGNLFGTQYSIFLGVGDGNYQAPTLLSTVVEPRGLALADIDRDGDLDIIGSSTAAQAAFVHFNNGSGSFGAANIVFNGPTVIPFVEVADLNRDGFLDMICAGTNIAILPGNGDGTFQAPLTITTSADVNSFSIADLDHDGVLDLAMSSLFGQRQIIELGNSDFTFQPEIVLGTSAGVSSRNSLGDFNNDGDLDLAVGQQGLATFDLFFGNGDGTFSALTQVGGLANTGNSAAADINQDGLDDLVMIDGPNNKVGVLLSNGNGTFQVNLFNAGNGVSDPSIADLNQDGQPDIVTANITSNSLSTFLSFFY